MTAKRADGIAVFLCENCNAVHIGMWRKGKMIAEAIPEDIVAFAYELGQAIRMSHAMKRRERPPSQMN